MAHHKRRRPKSTRAGCLFCKPWKRQGCDGRHMSVKKRDEADRADYGRKYACVSE